MTDYTVRKLDDVPDAFGGEYPGTMRFLTEPIGNQKVAFTHRVMPAQTGGKGSDGHRHKTQEEIYSVMSGRLQFTLGDEIHEVDGGTAVRVSPEAVRSVWNDGLADAELVIWLDPRGRSVGIREIVEGFRPE